MIQYVSFRDWHHYDVVVLCFYFIDTHTISIYSLGLVVYEIIGVCVCVCVCASAGSSPSACHLSGLVVVHCNDITPF